MRLVRNVSCILIVLANSDVKAGGWQYTSWGMTLDQVIESSHSQAFPLENRPRNFNDSIVRAATIYSAGSLRFNVFFGFNKVSKRLSSVSLELIDGKQCESLLFFLKQKYTIGKKTADDKIFEQFEWYDRPKDNKIIFNKINSSAVTKSGVDTCSIHYVSLGGPSDDQL